MIKNLIVLLKLRITLLVIITSYLGYYLGLRYLGYVMVELETIIKFFHLVIGVLFTASAFMFMGAQTKDSQVGRYAISTTAWQGMHYTTQVDTKTGESKTWANELQFIGFKVGGLGDGTVIENYK